MSSPDPVTPPVLPGAAQPWYTSKVQLAQIGAAVGAIVALSPKLGKLIGINTPADAEIWVESVAGAIAVLAPILGIIWRALSKLQPLTLTKFNAEVHPATLAAQAKAQAVPAAPFVPVIPVPLPAPGVPHAANPVASVLDVSFAAQPVGSVRPPGAAPPAGSRTP